MITKVAHSDFPELSRQKVVHAKYRINYAHECNLMLKGSAYNHPANHVAHIIGKSISCHKIWDRVLDNDPRGTEKLQKIKFFKPGLYTPTSAVISCGLIMAIKDIISALNML